MQPAVAWEHDPISPRSGPGSFQCVSDDQRASVTEYLHFKYKCLIEQMSQVLVEQRGHGYSWFRRQQKCAGAAGRCRDLTPPPVWTAVHPWPGKFEHHNPFYFNAFKFVPFL